MKPRELVSELVSRGGSISMTRAAEALERMIADLADEAAHDFPALEEAMETINHDDLGECALWIAAQIVRYHRADADSKADMRAFHASAGPAKVRDALRRLAEGGLGAKDGESGGEA